MKPLRRLLAIAAAFALVALPLGTVTIVGTGCATTVAPGADPIVVNAERSIKIAFDTVDAFIRWERANEASVPVSVHAAAETLRREFPDKFRLARSVLRAYKTTNRGPEQKALLDTYLAELAALASKAHR